MVSHVGILPSDVIDSLVARLNVPDEQSGLRFLRLPHPRTEGRTENIHIGGTDRSTSKRAVMVHVRGRSGGRSVIYVYDTQCVLMKILDGKLLMMTPVDPAFLLARILKAMMPKEGVVSNFRPADDIFEDAVEKLVRSPPASPNPKDPSTQLSENDLNRFLSLDCARSALKRVCETKEITPEIMVYRYSQEKFVETLKVKVARLAIPALFESSNTLIRGLAKDGLMEDGKEALLESGRMRAACDLVSQYIAPDVYNALLASYDFATLTVYLKGLDDEATAQAASRMDKVEARESTSSSAPANEKKRKGQAKASQGVEKLKKANTKGMSKLSSFFQAKSAS
ncbi:hypothetical protein EW026_g2960 [Hermanssonia centrifuga]|uniref:Ribonuclease H2 subunit B wHTH domain-containing protein n=1 Tax=Hermanssonia centrifuga TaxID=98765 RepID=A0A4S4KM72_9APHY|nr:hypothetical protein EW026_g2960 [Hermanssonia centrifuga]